MTASPHGGDSGPVGGRVQLGGTAAGDGQGHLGAGGVVQAQQGAGGDGQAQQGAGGAGQGQQGVGTKLPPLSKDTLTERHAPPPGFDPGLTGWVATLAPIPLPPALHHPPIHH